MGSRSAGRLQLSIRRRLCELHAILTVPEPAYPMGAGASAGLRGGLCQVAAADQLIVLFGFLAVPVSTDFANFCYGRSVSLAAINRRVHPHPTHKSNLA
jgi:hypothetical protein